MPVFFYIIAIVLIFLLYVFWKWKSRNRLKKLSQDHSAPCHEEPTLQDIQHTLDRSIQPPLGEFLPVEELNQGARHAFFKAQLLKATALFQQKSYREAEETLLVLLDEGHKYNDIFLMAETRYQLAYLSQLTHDLTSACENWHMAKEHFLQFNQQKDHDPVMRETASERIKDIEKIMRANGCPTEWVLTDF